MMRFIPLVPAAILLFVAPPVSAQEWVEYISQQDSFSINFPTEPEIRDVKYKSEYGVELPSRIYKSMDGKSQYLVTVVDYSNVRQIHAERLKNCDAAYPNLCGNPSDAELRGAIDFALWNFIQKGSKFTDYAYYNADRIEGRRLQLLNADGSKTFGAIHLHQNRLYIYEGTVPAGAPPPGLFQQSIGWVDKEGNRIRYRTTYSNAYPPPPLQLELSPLEGRYK
jgi:hypothetical protein